MLVYTVDVLALLKSAGYSSARMRKEKIFAESTIQKLRHKQPIAWQNIETICRLLGCQPGDFLQFVPDGGAEEASGK